MGANFLTIFWNAFFLEWRNMNFKWNITEACSQGFNLRSSSIGSDNVWRRPGAKPLSEPVMVSLLTHVNAWLCLSELKRYDTRILVPVIASRMTFPIERNRPPPAIEQYYCNWCIFITKIFYKHSNGVNFFFVTALQGECEYHFEQIQSMPCDAIQYMYVGQVLKVRLLCYLVLLSVDCKTR